MPRHILQVAYKISFITTPICTNPINAVMQTRNLLTLSINRKISGRGPSDKNHHQNLEAVGHTLGVVIVMMKSET